MITRGCPTWACKLRSQREECLRALGAQPPDKQVPRALLRVFIGSDDLFPRLSLPLRAPMTRQEFASSAVEVTLDASRARSELGYRPVVTLDAGIAMLKRQLAEQG